MANTQQTVSVKLIDDFSKLSSDLDRVNKQVEQLLANLKGIQGLDLNGLGNIGNSRGAMRSADALNKSLKDAFSIGKLYFFYNYAKTMFRGIGRVMNAALDYTETENKFARAMNGMYGKAMDFQNKLQEAYGLSATSMMNMQSTFKNMLGTVGNLSDEVSEQISETVSLMAIDYASLFNTTIDDAAKKFEAALAKQVRPIRSGSGYDITTSTLQGTLDELGMARSVSQLSQIEQRLLIIITLQKQMAASNAMGDWARTIEQPANQLRILQQQVATTARWIGSVFYGAIAGVLPILNAFVMVVNKAIAALAALFGYKLPNSSGSGGGTIIDALNSSSDSAGDLSNNLGKAGGNAGKVGKGVGAAKKATDKAAKSAEKWKNVLMGFDVANVMPDQSSSGGSGGGSGGGGGGGSGGGGGGSGGGASGGSAWGVDEGLLNALKTYEGLLESITMKANQLRDAFLKLFEIHVWNNFLTSLQKYGKAISESFSGAVSNIKYIFGGIIDTIGQNWDVWFKSASDLFLSLIDTAGKFAQTVTHAMKSAWDNGGQYFLQGVIDLATSFNHLGTSLLDNFVKPVISFFDKYFSGNIGALFGNFLGAIGEILQGVAKIIDAFAEWEAGVKALGVVLTGLAIAKFVTHLNSCWLVAGRLIEAFGGGAGLGSKIAQVGASLLLTTNAGSGVVTMITKLVSGFYSVTTQVGLFAIKLGTGLTKLAEFAGAKGLTGLGTLLGNAGEGVTGLGAAFGSLSLTLPVVATAIGVVAAALTAFAVVNKATQMGLIGTSKEVKQLKQELDGYVASSKEAAKNAKLTFTTTSDGVMLEKYVKDLKAMEKASGKNGYVGNMNKAKALVAKINEILPGTVRLTKDGKVVWEKTNKEIKKAIKNLKEEARQQAYINAYSKIYENQLKIQQKIAEAKEKVAKYQEKYNKAVEKINKAMQSGNTVTAEMTSEATKWSGKLREANQELSASEEALKKNTKEAQNLDKAWNDTGDSAEKNAKKTKDSAKDMESAITDSSKKIRKDLEDNGVVIGELGEKAGSKYGGDLAKALKATASEIGMSVDELYAAAKERAKDKNITFSAALEQIKKEELQKRHKEAQAQADALGGISFEPILKSGVDGLTEGVTVTVNGIVKSASVDKDCNKPTVTSKGNVASAGVDDKCNKPTVTSKGNVTSASVSSKCNKPNISTSATISSIKLSNSAKAGLKGAVNGILKGFKIAHGGFVHNRARSQFVSTFSKGGFADVKKYGSAGVPNVGQVFIAREAGPELVGNLGSRHNAVANNDQIVQGIYRGVLQAMRDSHAINSQSQGGDINIYVQEESGRTKLKKTISDYNRYMIETGGKGGFVV